MSRSTLAAWLPLCALIACGSLGCTSNNVLKSAGPPPAGLAALPPVARLALADSEEFFSEQDGADFAEDLEAQACAVDGGAAQFTPQIMTADGRSVLDTAYSLYRLKLDPAKLPVTLTLVWAGGEPEEDCWIGLANWNKLVWDWRLLPAGGNLTLADPTTYSDANMHCYAAVVVQGENAHSLATIGYEPEPPPPPPTGEGYTLYTRLLGRTTGLVDMDGTVVHTWQHTADAGFGAALLEDGHLLRPEVLPGSSFSRGVASGRIAEFDWDGNMLWHFDLRTEQECLHHDVRYLPNGHILAIAWRAYTLEECTALGRDPALFTPNGLWFDEILELEPTGAEGANIVWMWNAADHLVQNIDSKLPNYADPALHPELVDINYDDVGLVPDFLHSNGVYYNAELDQIILSVREFSEFWIIDHSTTTEEAASHSGGRYGRGGDLLYRWGNPAAYSAGTKVDRQLFYQHDAQWIEDGLPGAGNILVYNNDSGTPTSEHYSTVVEITPPYNPDGSYYLGLEGGAYGPPAPSWQYIADPPASFYSQYISSAQRLPGGNTLICCSGSGWFFEVTPAGEKVWEYTVQTSAQVVRCVRYPYDYPGVAALGLAP